MINLRVSTMYKGIVLKDKIVSVVVKAFEYQKINPDEVEISIVIEDDKKLKELNQRFLGIDAVTDVLSFSLNEKDPENGRLYLGDVIISFPRALEQSTQAGHTVMDELNLLTVHGVLHLLGYDHAEPDSKVKMWNAQSEILETMHVFIKKLPED